MEECKYSYLHSYPRHFPHNLAALILGTDVPNSIANDPRAGLNDSELFLLPEGEPQFLGIPAITLLLDRLTYHILNLIDTGKKN